MAQIAVIDDDPEVVQLLTGWLKEIVPGDHVSPLLDLESALSAISNTDFDLVVADVDLGPGADKFGGVKIARALDTRRIPLLVVSGSPEYEVQHGVFKALDAWDYLQKPISRVDFELQVRRAIAFRRGASDPANFAIDGEFHLVPDLKITRKTRSPVQWKAKTVRLSMSQIEVVETLAKNAGQTVKHAVLYEAIASGKNIENLRVKISAIRDEFRAVDPQFDRIKAIQFVGYQWRVD
jgi:DNA-binding response OmpR family regulator